MFEDSILAPTAPAATLKLVEPGFAIHQFDRCHLGLYNTQAYLPPELEFGAGAGNHAGSLGAASRIIDGGGGGGGGDDVGSAESGGGCGSANNGSSSAIGAGGGGGDDGGCSGGSDGSGSDVEDDVVLWPSN